MGFFHFFLYFSVDVIYIMMTSMTSGTVQEALAAERALITFNPTKLSEFLYGKAFYHKMLGLLNKYDIPPHDFNEGNRGRVGLIKQAIRDFPIIYNNIRERGFDEINTIYMILSSANQMPGGVHIGMFRKCIEILGTDRQRQLYLEKCSNFEVVGAYAQTEMAHGSDVSSLMTTATMDTETGEFIVETPNIRAIKFWPGELGLFSTHALVFAQLRIKDKSFGVHSFIVPIRGPDHKPLPGVECGDIGPKIGYHSKDNGYLILHKVRIPRENMLRRFISVTKEGEIKIKGDPKISYATMMEVRKHLTCSWPKVYAQGITIASRYSMFRRMFENAAKQQIKVMDYQLQQDKLISRAAEYYAITLTGNKIRDITDENIRRVNEKQDFSLMAETHACLSLGKPYFGELSLDGLQICRKACGGHGYSNYSGIPGLIAETCATVTLEGQNTVLYLQVARYLLKSLKHSKTKKKELGKSVKYIESMDQLLEKRVSASQPSTWTLEDIRVILAQSSCFLLNLTAIKLMNRQEGFSDKDAWNYTSGIRLRQLAMVHSVYFTFDTFREAVFNEQDFQIQQITRDLCMLFGIGAVTSQTIVSPILEGGFLTSEQMSSLCELKEHLLAKLRPNFIGILDGFGIPDKYYRSALIRGNPYENYLKLAKENELNQSRLESVDVVAGIGKVMRNPDASL